MTHSFNSQSHICHSFIDASRLSSTRTPPRAGLYQTTKQLSLQQPTWIGCQTRGDGRWTGPKEEPVLRARCSLLSPSRQEFPPFPPSLQRTSRLLHTFHDTAILVFYLTVLRTLPISCSCISAFQICRRLALTDADAGCGDCVSWIGRDGRLRRSCLKAR